MFLATIICRDESKIVVTKMILVAALANDTGCFTTHTDNRHDRAKTMLTITLEASALNAGFNNRVELAKASPSSTLQQTVERVKWQDAHTCTRADSAEINWTQRKVQRSQQLLSWDEHLPAESRNGCGQGRCRKPGARKRPPCRLPSSRWRCRQRCCPCAPCAIPQSWNRAPRCTHLLLAGERKKQT